MSTPARLLEQLEAQVPRGPVAERRKAGLALLRPRPIDESLQVVRRYSGRDHQHMRVGRQLRHRLEVLARVVGQALDQIRIDDEAGRHHEERVAIGGLAQQRLRADNGTAAGPVLDDHGNPRFPAHRLRQRSRQGIGRTAGRVRHDQRQRLRRKLLRRGRRGHQAQTQTEHELLHGDSLNEAQEKSARRAADGKPMAMGFSPRLPASPAPGSRPGSRAWPGL